MLHVHYIKCVSSASSAELQTKVVHIWQSGSNSLLEVLYCSQGSLPPIICVKLHADWLSRMCFSQCCTQLLSTMHYCPMSAVLPISITWCDLCKSRFFVDILLCESQVCKLILLYHIIVNCCISVHFSLSKLHIQYHTAGCPLRFLHCIHIVLIKPDLVTVQMVLYYKSNMSRYHWTTVRCQYCKTLIFRVQLIFASSLKSRVA